VTWLTLSKNLRPIEKSVAMVFTFDHALFFEDFDCPLKLDRSTTGIFPACLLCPKLKSWGICGRVKPLQNQIPG
jgi:hypothetical protein